TRRNQLRRLTNDLYDDLDPSFIPGTSRIVFSSNRTSDTLRSANAPEFNALSGTYNLFVFDLDTTNNLLARVTNTLSKDYSPLALDDDNFFYLSDQRGITNLFRYNRSTGIYTQVTNFSSSLHSYDVNFESGILAYVTIDDRKHNIFVDRNFDVNRQIFTPATRRKELQQARVIRERRKQEETQYMSIKDLLNARLKETQDPSDSVETIPPLQDTLNIQIDDPAVVSGDTIPTDESVVNTDNYEFDESAQESVEVKTDNYQFEDDATRERQPSE